MEFKHKSVLLRECIDNLNIDPDGVYVDGTLGGGGHSSAICERLSAKGLLIGIDRDKDALEAAQKKLIDYDCKKIFVQSNYSEIKNALKDHNITGIDGGLLDLGVSSFQLDNSQRGFSYMQDAPLDMRMNQDDTFTAYDVVNGYSEKELSRIIKKYGEEKWAARIAKFIVETRQNGNIESTGEMVDIIKRAIPAAARRDGPHPAKRTFQAIRIEVNDELGQLERAVEDFCDVLNPKGRLCIISFHSLEDRIVKDIFNERVNPCTCPKGFPCICGKVADVKKISRKPIIPSDEELEFNPRSRSAKLRVLEKL
ncbi:MAG: 16S rRNA (cytosine(1402)-N(4))-methyltransferase RsmH [Anaerovoracaceae bacterium]